MVTQIATTAPGMVALENIGAVCCLFVCLFVCLSCFLVFNVKFHSTNVGGEERGVGGRGGGEWTNLVYSLQSGS